MVRTFYRWREGLGVLMMDESEQGCGWTNLVHSRQRFVKEPFTPLLNFNYHLGLLRSSVNIPTHCLDAAHS